MLELSRDLPTETPSVGHQLDSARRDLGGRRTLFVVVAFVCGLALNWNWLVVAGMISLLLAASFCIAMYAAETDMKVDDKRLPSIASDPYLDSPSSERRLTGQNV
tara:strand:- start:205 stop:519 length:315 start_codon:yes stop_codon:yes gene_type:complete